MPDAFVTALATAINARDIEKVKKITHPGTLKCMTPDTWDYYSWWLWKDGGKSYTIPSSYQTRLDAPLHVAKDGTREFLPHWPVQPDAGLYLTYNSAKMSVVERLFEITLKKGEALLVMDCPTAQGLEVFHENRIADAAQKKKLERLWQSLSTQDRQAFELMAKQGMKLDGMKAAEQKYHLDTGESLVFMDMIEYADTP